MAVTFRTVRFNADREQYIDHFEILFQRLNINQETKLCHFVNGHKPHRKESLLLRQPPGYNTAVSDAELNDFGSTNNYDRLLEQIKQVTHANILEELPRSS